MREWTEEHVYELLEAAKQNKHILNKGEQFSSALHAHFLKKGIRKYSQTQMLDKWNNLKKSYKNCKVRHRVKKNFIYACVHIYVRLF